MGDVFARPRSLIEMVPLVAASARGWQQAVDAILSGKVVAFPTDTVYGIGCSAFDVDAIKLIYTLKGRSTTKALPLLLSDPAQLQRVAITPPPIASKLGQTFWPGALTLVMKRRAELPAELSGDDTIALRVPDHLELRDFLEACGGFLAVTSANLSGQPDALTAQEVVGYFERRIAMVVDGGPVAGGRPSTVIDCTHEAPVLLRQGAIPREDIEEILQLKMSDRNV